MRLEPLWDRRGDRWNFRVLLGQGVLAEVGNQLSSERLVLPFLYTAFGGPPFFAGLLLPIVNIVTLGSQLFGAPSVEAASRSKWYLAATIAFTAAVVTAVNLSASALQPVGLVAIFLAAAVLIGLSRGLNMIAYQDMLGRVLAEDLRARLLYAIAAAAGVVAAIMAVAYHLTHPSAGPQHAPIGLVWFGIGMLIFAAVGAAAVREAPKTPGPAATGGEMVARARRYVTDLSGKIGVVWQLTWFRRFLRLRVLLLSVELAMPFFAIHAARFHADTNISLTSLVVAAGAGMVLGGVVWPRFGARSVKPVIAVSAVIAGLAATNAAADHLIPSLDAPITHAITIMLLAFAVQGAVSARIVYVVGAATDAERPYCVALSDVAAGVAGLLFALAVSAIVHDRGAIFGLLGMGAMNAAAALYVWRLPDIRHADGTGAPPSLRKRLRAG